MGPIKSVEKNLDNFKYYLKSDFYSKIKIIKW